METVQLIALAMSGLSVLYGLWKKDVVAVGAAVLLLLLAVALEVLPAK